MNLPTLQQIQMMLAEKSLPAFIKQAWPVIEPGTPYLNSWHIDCICDFLQAVDAGHITRLLINMPPRYMKSICVSVMWPVWSWIAKPESRWLFASYAGNLSMQHSVDRRTIINSDYYQDRWGSRYKLTTDQNVKTEYANDRQGRMFATSFDGSATGKGGDRIIIDDPHDPKGAESDVQRETTLTTFRRKLSTRLNNKKTGAIVVVMQRLHEKDVSALCIEEGYTHLCLENPSAKRTTISAPGGRVWHREPGDILWPEREGERELDQARMQLGPYGFAGQYGQSPAPAGGGRFKEQWLRYFDRIDDTYRLWLPDGSYRAVPVDDCSRFAMMDPAGTDKAQNDKACYTVIGAYDVTPTGDMLRFDQFRGQVEAPDAAEKAIEFTRRNECEWIGVEKNGMGLGVVQTIRRRGVAVRAILARGSKEARSETAEIRMAAGMVYLPKNAPWLFDWITEFTRFPNGEYADQVDEFAHAARWVHRSMGAPMGEEDSSVSPVAHELAETIAIKAERLESYDDEMAWTEIDG